MKKFIILFKEGCELNKIQTYLTSINHKWQPEIILNETPQIGSHIYLNNTKFLTDYTLKFNEGSSILTPDKIIKEKFGIYKIINIAYSPYSNMESDDGKTYLFLEKIY